MAKARNKEKSSDILLKAPLWEKADLTAIRYLKQTQHMQNYLRGFFGYDPDSQDPLEAATQDSLYFADQLRPTSSVILEPSIEGKGQFYKELESVVAAAEALFTGFDDLITRCARHTDLCIALRALRAAAEAKPKSSFFRVIVDIHDCVRFTRPEDMAKKMAEVISDVVSNLSYSIAKEESFSITDKLFDAGLRPWSPPRGGTEEDK